MGDVRFPYKAWQRRASEAEGMTTEALKRWLNSPTKAKRLAAAGELRRRAKKA